ncbi:hypothetical protein LQL77_31830 [Rhodococcus cerastii]|nr:hypothetical protein [Rhodococcus cerastii]
MLALLAVVITAPIVVTNMWTWTGAGVLLVVVTGFSASRGKRGAVQDGLNPSPCRPNQLWFSRAVWAFVLVAVFVLVADGATAERWLLSLIGASVGVIAFSEGFALWSEVPAPAESMEVTCKYGVLLTSVAIVAGVYVVADTPTLAEAESIKAAVSTALGAADSATATPGAPEGLTPLSDEQLDRKYSAAETWLRSLFSGPPLERELFALSKSQEAERDLNFRYVGGGADVLEWNRITVHGDTARATGRNDRWIDTAVPDAGGHYSVHRSSPAHYSFTVELRTNSDGSWIVTNSVVARDISER